MECNDPECTLLYAFCEFCGAEGYSDDDADDKDYIIQWLKVNPLINVPFCPKLLFLF